METKTWYLSEQDFLRNSFCIPGVALTENEANEAEIILDVAKRACGTRFGGYRIEVDGIKGRSKPTFIRGHRIQTQSGPLHALREIPDVLPMLSGTGFFYDVWLQRQLLSPEISQGGMLLVAGSAGTGKSTTMAATTISRLHAYGSMAITLEDPPEYRLQGMHGKGSCLQMPASSPDEFPGLIMDALRCYPAGLSSMMLLISEIRNGETASLALEAAMSGHVVITSIHASSVESAIARMTTLAGQVLGMQVARSDAAEALKICVYQRRAGKAIQFQALKNIQNYAVAAKIRDGQFHTLSGDIQSQEASAVDKTRGRM